MTTLMLIVLLLGLLAMRMPIAIAMLTVALVYFAMPDTMPVSEVVPQMIAALDNFVLVAIPMFILMGVLANSVGLTDRIFDLASGFLGRLPASLGYVNVAVSFGFSWMSGSAIADIAGLGRVVVPAMQQRGYPDRFASGVTLASATIGPIMPPSIPAVVYALASGVSLGAMLVAGVFPAIIITFCLVAYVFLWSTRNTTEGRHGRLVRGEASGLLLRGMPGLLAPVILIGGILGGYFTPTEAAGVAALYVLLLGLAYRSISISGMSKVLQESVGIVGGALLIVASASLLSTIFVLEGAPRQFGDLVNGIDGGPWVFLLCVNLLAWLVGMIIEPTSAILMLTPIVLPIAVSHGIDPIHLGVVLILNLMIGLLTPPVGLSIFVLRSVTEVSMVDLWRGALGFLAPLMVALVVITYVPLVSTWLPAAVGF